MYVQYVPATVTGWTEARVRVRSKPAINKCVFKFRTTYLSRLDKHKFFQAAHRKRKYINNLPMKVTTLLTLPTVLALASEAFTPSFHMSIRPRLLVSSSSPYEEDPRPDLAPVHDTQNQGHRKEFAFEVNAFDAILNGEVEKMEQMKSLIEDIKDMRKLDPSAGDNESPDQRERIDRLLDNAIDAANKIEEMDNPSHPPDRPSSRV